MTNFPPRDASAIPRKIAVMDYGVGNLNSLAGALKRLNYRVRVSSEPSEFYGVDAVVLPGVGAMNTAIENLRNLGLDGVIERLLSSSKTPVIGICLGMQLMFEHSEEGDIAGLNLLPGRVRRFLGSRCHVGWAVCGYPAGSGSYAEGAFYFNHSYFVDADPRVVKSQVNVDGHGKIAAIVRYRNFTGLQFHPEKSQATGAELFRHIIETNKVESHA